MFNLWPLQNIVLFCSSYLCDVTMKSLDGKDFPCHKCVLCARLGRYKMFHFGHGCVSFWCKSKLVLTHTLSLSLFSDYFHSMFSSSWIEVSVPICCAGTLLFLLKLPNIYLFIWGLCGEGNCLHNCLQNGLCPHKSFIPSTPDLHSMPWVINCFNDN